MKTGPILVTSFQTWRAHQRVNSSDELMATLQAGDRLPDHVHWLRRVSVSFQLAPMEVLSELYRLRPRIIICCGMAENRALLTLEQQAKRQTLSLKTPIELPALLKDTYLSAISNDAGGYVCNHLYYSVLDFIYRTQIDTIGLFVHVPALTRFNKGLILHDFACVVSRLTEMY